MSEQRSFHLIRSLSLPIVGVFIVVMTPARIAQYSYDKARLLASTRFGWLVLAGVMCELIEMQNYYVQYSLSVT